MNSLSSRLDDPGAPVPHITIEYTANVAEHHDIDALVQAVHAAALEHGLPALDALRTRAVARSHYRIADGDPHHAFVAIAVRIGPGRTADEKTSFVHSLLGAAERQVAGAPGPLAIAWSVELAEIDPAFRVNHNEVRDRIATNGRGGDL